VNSKGCPDKFYAILLAAGGSTRLGVPKQLLIWRGKPLICYILEQFCNSKIDSTIVVLGDKFQKITKEISHFQVKIVKNINWQNGIGSTIKAGLKATPKDARAVVISVIDQPYLTSALINSEIEVYKKTRAQIVAPLVENIQTNPVLFDKSVFNSLLLLKDDEGAKEILKDFYLQFIKWSDVRILMDIDTKNDFQRITKQG